MAAKPRAEARIAHDNCAENAEQSLDIVELNLKDAVAVQPFAVAKDTKHPCLMRRLLEAKPAAHVEVRA